MIKITTPIGNQIAVSFFDGAHVVTSGAREAQYHVSFSDMDAGRVIYEAEIPTGHFAAPNAKYFVRWRVAVREDGTLVADVPLDLRDAVVFIGLTSRALGDTIAWIPYADEFRRAHGCRVRVQSFWNHILADAYPNVQFVDAADPETCDAGYLVGAWDNNYARNRNNWRLVPLQQVACDCLGIAYREVRSRLAVQRKERPVAGPYVAVTEHSTFRAKQWLRPGGWDELIRHTNSAGREVVAVSREESSLTGVVKQTGRTIEETLSNIAQADAFVGTASGLAWAAWALDVPTVVFGGWSLPFSEMRDCVRVHNPSACSGCYNDPDLPFDRGNFEWCPRGRTFECSTSIPPAAMTAALDEALRRREAAPPVERRRVLMLLPHCSTGGMPQYATQAVEQLLAAGDDVIVAEWRCLSQEYVVQRSRLRGMCRFEMLEGSAERLLALLRDFRPDVVHLQEFSETFLPDDAANALWRGDRSWRLVETTHGSDVLAGAPKRRLPDAFALVTPFHVERWRATGVPCDLALYSLPRRARPDRETALRALGLDPSRRHVLQVGLFTPGKAQDATFAAAREMPDVEFHFVGNQAPNFAAYWEPLMRARPENCRVWGERTDVERFYAACDVLVFPSRDECAPIVLREAEAWGLPAVVRWLPQYERAGFAAAERFASDAELPGALRKKLPTLGSALARAYGFDADRIPGWFDARNRAQLEKLIRRHNVRHVVEIGSYKGLSAAWFARRVERVTCVDRWTGWEENGRVLGDGDCYEEFRRNMRLAGVSDRVMAVRGDSRTMAEVIGAADLVYIDGDHSREGVAADIRAYLPKARRVICGDDYTDRPGFGVREAVDGALPWRRVDGAFWWADTARVAVVTPNLNCGPQLGHALASVRAQTVPASDLIVVDGGSDDGSQAAAHALGARWLVEREGRMARAKNVGFRAADAEWVVTLDADDWIAPRFIEACLERADDGVGVVATQMVLPSGELWRPDPPFTLERLTARNRLFCCSLVRRAAWESVGGYDENPETYEDWDLWCRIVKAGWRIEAVQEPLFHYCPRPEGSTARMAPGAHEAYSETVRRNVAAFVVAR